jgi:hypothetical protein
MTPETGSGVLEQTGTIVVRKEGPQALADERLGWVDPQQRGGCGVGEADHAADVNDDPLVASFDEASVRTINWRCR